VALSSAAAEDAVFGEVGATGLLVQAAAASANSSEAAAMRSFIVLPPESEG
jgi:hypothetical protein